jgi:hypothetical protein
MVVVNTPFGKHPKQYVLGTSRWAVNNKQEVLLVGQDKLIPNFGGNYNDSQFQAKITSSLQLFDRVKNDFDSPYNPEKARIQGRMQEPSLPYESLFNLCISIAHHLNKPASKLTHDEIKVHFEDHIPNIIGFQNISGC